MTTRKLAAAVATAALTLGLITVCGGDAEAEDTHHSHGDADHARRSESRDLVRHP